MEPMGPMVRGRGPGQTKQHPAVEPVGTFELHWTAPHALDASRFNNGSCEPQKGIWIMACGLLQCLVLAGCLALSKVSAPEDAKLARVSGAWKYFTEFT
ncbi:hypothetical protein VTJ04DRAFT_980 [Mycothermus thermophilus]|uniref:uncharacterized protein n=1 Tax=Humicola insolens TaxID=85995 RepID=UPI0037439EE6